MDDEKGLKEKDKERSKSQKKIKRNWRQSGRSQCQY